MRLYKITALLVGLVALMTSHGYANPVGKKLMVRVTYYYPNEDNSGYKASTGVKLQPWVHCAIDPKMIPYFKSITIPNLGTFLSVDRGSAVVTRKAAKLQGRSTPVIDVCVRNRKEMLYLASTQPMFQEVIIN